VLFGEQHDRVEDAVEVLTRCDPLQQAPLPRRQRFGPAAVGNVGAELRLHLPGPGDVGHGADDPDGDVGPIGDHIAPHHDSRVGAVGAAEAVLLLPGALTARQGALDASDDALAVFAVDVLVPPGGRGGVASGRVSQQRFQPFAPDHTVGDEVPIPGGVPGGLDHQPVTLLALPQLGFRALAVADVLDGVDEVPGPALSVGHQSDGHQSPGGIAAAPHTAVLGGVAGTFARQQESHGLALHRSVIRVNDALGQGAQQLFLPVAQQLADRLVEPGPAPLGRGDTHGDAGVLEDVWRAGPAITVRLEGLGRLKHAQLDLRGGAGGQILEQQHVPLGPETGQTVHHAERADDQALPREQRHAGVRDPAELADGGVAAEEGVPAGVFDYQRLAGQRHMTAEGVGEREPAPACPGLGQTRGALEELTVFGDQRDEGYRRAEKPGGHPSQPVEGFLGRRVQQRGPGDSGEAFVGVSRGEHPWGDKVSRETRLGHQPSIGRPALRLKQRG
jgi:hypothetical protein